MECSSASWRTAQNGMACRAMRHRLQQYVLTSSTMLHDVQHNARWRAAHCSMTCSTLLHHVQHTAPSRAAQCSITCSTMLHHVQHNAPWQAAQCSMTCSTKLHDMQHNAPWRLTVRLVVQYNVRWRAAVGLVVQHNVPWRAAVVTGYNGPRLPKLAAAKHAISNKLQRNQPTNTQTKRKNKYIFIEK